MPFCGVASARFVCRFTSKFCAGHALEDASSSMHIVPAATLLHLSMPTSNAMLNAFHVGGRGTEYQLPPLSSLCRTGAMLCQQR